MSLAEIWLAKLHPLTVLAGIIEDDLYQVWVGCININYTSSGRACTAKLVQHHHMKNHWVYLHSLQRERAKKWVIYLGEKLL